MYQGPGARQQHCQHTEHSLRYDCQQKWTQRVPGAIFNMRQVINEGMDAVNIMPISCLTIICSSGDDAKAQAAWEEAWIQPALRLLAAADDRMRTHLSIYALPIPLGKSPASILQLLNCLLHPGNPELATAQVCHGPDHPTACLAIPTAYACQRCIGSKMLAVVKAQRIHKRST